MRRLSNCSLHLGCSRGKLGKCRPMMNKPPPVEGLNIRISIITIKGRGLHYPAEVHAGREPGVRRPHNPTSPLVAAQINVQDHAAWLPIGQKPASLEP